MQHYFGAFENILEYLEKFMGYILGHNWRQSKETSGGQADQMM